MSLQAPDDSTPGGSYYYHWMRDAGLSIKTWMDINDNDYDTCREVLEAYLGWVGKVQQKNDPNGIDIEPFGPPSLTVSLAARNDVFYVFLTQAFAQTKLEAEKY